MPSLKSIDTFKGVLSGGGARANLFEVQLTGLPGGVENASQLWSKDVAKTFSFLCKSAALPASNVGAVEVPFRGKILKVAGDRTFDTWTVTVINDENFAIRTALEEWSRSMVNYTTAAGLPNPTDYQTDATIYQLGRKGGSGADNYLKAYSFYGIFPTNIGQIDLSYDNADTVEEYTVEFQVQYWKPGVAEETGEE